MSTSFNLPDSLRPGTDRISKEVTRNPAVINIITKAILNIEDEYLLESTNWPNGTHSDVVLVSKSMDSGLPPIIIEFQQNVDNKFMKRAIGYCIQADKRFEVDPILLVICINSLSVTLKNNFENCENLPCYVATCDYWANRCYVVDESSIKNHTASDPGLDSNLDPFTTYCLFLTSQATSIDLAPAKENATMKMLYNISQIAYAKLLDKDASVMEELNKFNDMSRKQYKKELAMLTDDSLPRSTIKEYASQSLQYSIQQKENLIRLLAKITFLRIKTWTNLLK